MLVKARPDFKIEISKQRPVIGVDEAGRGPLAGPVVAAAIVLDDSAITLGINDSKKLSEKKRQEIYRKLISNYQYSVSVIEPDEIDELNILQATMKAMRECLGAFKMDEFSVLIDGNKSPISNDNNIECIVGGDAKSISIAAASIIAKVERDAIMSRLSMEFPMYGWAKNKGYGTKDHIENIRIHGICKYHRKSFTKNFIC